MVILTVDIGGTAIKVGKINKLGELTEFQEFENDGKKGGSNLISRLFDILDRYSDYSAIGISTAGQVDSEKGKIIYANDNIPNYTGTELQKIVGNKYGVPVRVENDVNAAALGEKYFGAGQPFRDFLCLTYGTGVGGAIIMNSTIYKGINGVAGEFGHMLVHYNGEQCNCGKCGCYESYASTSALLKKTIQVDSRFSNGKIVFEQYTQNNKAVQEIVEGWVTEIAIGLVSLVHIFNPMAIVIGGGVMEQKELVNQIEKKVQSMIMHSFSDVKLLQAGLGNKAGLYGVASLHLVERKEV